MARPQHPAAPAAQALFERIGQFYESVIAHSPNFDFPALRLLRTVYTETLPTILTS
jgi:hypothetical protein